MHNAISSFESGAATHVGKVRQQNEDSYLVSTESGVWAVADGMGGHEAGDVASHTVVEELEQITTPTSAANLLADCEARMVNANNRLKRLADARGWALIGTTVAILLIYEEFFACVWSGDSRIYRIRRSQIEQLSIDHTEVQELETGDIFVICSDGLTNHVDNQEILALATSNLPQRACDLLIDLTLDRGATDNVTVVVVRFDPSASTMMPNAARNDLWE